MYKHTGKLTVVITTHKGDIPKKLSKRKVKQMISTNISYADWKPAKAMWAAVQKNYIKTASRTTVFNPKGQYKGHVVFNVDAEHVKAGLKKCLQDVAPKVRSHRTPCQPRPPHATHRLCVSVSALPARPLCV